MSCRKSLALPTNITNVAFLVRVALIFLSGSIFLPSSLSPAHATEPNDSFDDATVLPAGAWTVTDSIEGGSPAPDTFLGFFADDTFPLPALATDDDSSPLGDGFGDALFDIPVNPNGSIPLIVTGCCSEDFDGSHGEEGDYELFVDVFDASGTPIDSFSVLETLEMGVVDEHPFSNPTWIGGTFDAIIDNTVGFSLGFDPLDFWIFTGLPAGETFQAETTEGDFDTIIGLFASDGTLLEANDDAGIDTLSLLTGIVPPSGEVILAVTGFNDFDLDGFHSEIGSYELTVSIVPEPATLTSLLVGLATLVSRRRPRGETKKTLGK